MATPCGEEFDKFSAGMPSLLDIRLKRNLLLQSMHKDVAAHRSAVQEPTKIQLPTSVAQVYRLVGNIAVVNSNCTWSGSRVLDKVLNR